MPSEIVTADTLNYSADNTTWPTADGGILGNIISAEVIEPCGAEAVTADSTWPTADHVGQITADGGILGGAADVLDAIVIAADAAIVVEAASAADFIDAEVIAAEVPVSGGGYYRPLRPFLVEGVGYGVLPALEGEAFGQIGIAGAGVGVLPGLVGEAAGAVGVVGRSAAQLVVRAAASGERGAAGIAAAALEELSIAGNGTVGTRGSGSGTIMKFKATASGQHDDDEAAVMTFLLAA
jgi:hypothetical protein